MGPSFTERLEALLAKGHIGGFVEPHDNHGAAGGQTPWVIIPPNLGRASTYATDERLHEAISTIEEFGPFNPTPDGWIR